MQRYRRTRRPAGAAPGEKGLKTGAIGFVSSIVIGVASTAPGYSLAATLGFIVAVVGFQAPAILLMAFVPMFLVAGGYYYMNRADPDCGTSFSWVTKAMGPQLGWLAGWAIVVADVIVMANLAQIAGLYTFLLFDANSLADSTFWVTFVGVIWIIIMTAIVTIGIELSARTQVGLLGAEIITLAAFAVVALVKVYAGSAPSTSVHPSFSWINPLEVSTTAISSGLLLAVFIYWGWDTTATVNEETEDSTEAPGKATVVSTVILLGIYVIVAVAALAYAGLGELRHNKDDVLSALGNEVFGSPLDKILIIAVLTSAAASTQTTILPTARTTLSMARAKAMPSALGRVHPRFLTPARLDHPDGPGINRLVRLADDLERGHPVRLAGGARPDDLLLLSGSPDSHARSSTGASCSTASRISSSSASGRRPAGRSSSTC